jgi:hypothetical protein
MGSDFIDGEGTSIRTWQSLKENATLITRSTCNPPDAPPLPKPSNLSPANPDKAVLKALRDGEHVLYQRKMEAHSSGAKLEVKLPQ